MEYVENIGTGWAVQIGWAVLPKLAKQELYAKALRVRGKDP
jgi:hypothetical protein